MRTIRQIRRWDRVKAEFVEVPIESSLDTQMSCNECRYFNSNNDLCYGVGSLYYMKRVPSPEYVPKHYECNVRLPPSLLAYY